MKMKKLEKQMEEMNKKLETEKKKNDKNAENLKQKDDDLKALAKVRFFCIICWVCLLFFVVVVFGFVCLVFVLTVRR